MSATIIATFIGALLALVSFWFTKRKLKRLTEHYQSAEEIVRESRMLMERFDKIGIRNCITGSLFFGGWKAGKSDIDLIAEYSPGALYWLKINGYEEVCRRNGYSGYRDPLIVAHYRKYVGHLHIDVQLTQNFDMKQMARDLLKESDSYQKASKKNRIALWNYHYNNLPI